MSGLQECCKETLQSATSYIISLALTKQTKFITKGVFGTAPQTPSWNSSTKNWSSWSTSLGALTTPPFFLELSAWS